MLKRIAVPLALGLVAFLCPVLRAQTQPTPNADDQAMRAQMQQMMMQMTQNMLAQGINPQEFFQQIGQQMQDGTLDMATLQKQLVEKGILDQQSIDKMQTTVQSSALRRIRQRLDVTDDEWVVIAPKIQKVLSASAALGQTTRMGPMGGMMGGQAQPSPVALATADLRAALKDPNTNSDIIADKLKTLRTARETATAALATAQKELVEILTNRQEAVLTNMGLLQ